MIDPLSATFAEDSQPLSIPHDDDEAEGFVRG